MYGTNGRKILFGDRMTDSMKDLIEQTESRRKIQDLNIFLEQYCA